MDSAVLPAAAGSSERPAALSTAPLQAAAAVAPTVISPANDSTADMDIVVEDIEVEEEEDSHYLGAIATATHNYTKVVGIRFYAGVAHPGEYVHLSREPSNPYDSNAVRVDNCRGQKVGHLTRQIASKLSPFMLRHPDVKVDATIQANPRPNGYDLPIEIRFYGPLLSVSSVVEQTFQPFAFRGQRHKAAPPPPPLPASAATVKTVHRQVDWRDEQKVLDDLLQTKKLNLPTVPTPPALLATLLPHQVQGLAWLVHRETTTSGHTTQKVPFYKQIQEQGRQVWFCDITRASQPEAPKPVLGGILADDMGLGKTVQTIALLLANPPAGRDYTKPLVVVKPVAAPDDKNSTDETAADTPPVVALKKPTKTALNKVKITPLQNVLRAAGLQVPMYAKKTDVVKAVLEGLEAGRISLPVYYETIAKPAAAPSSSATSTSTTRNAPSPTTLIVCPVSVLSNWQSQIQAHVAPDTLRVALYHGTDRRELLADLHEIDVLICSYNTLQTDYTSDRIGKEGQQGEPPAAKRFKSTSIFQTIFHRVVLDEAHIVRNPKSRTFQACASLQATRRWCLSGTPLQNKPQDIQSLLQFLGVAPLHDPDVFRRAVVQPIKEGTDRGLALLRLSMAHYALRRNKSMADLKMAPKQVSIVHVTMGPENQHQAIHDAIFRSAKVCLQATLQGGDESALKQTASVFEVLLRLRQACCSGALVPVERLERAEQVLALIDNKTESLSVKEGLELLAKLKGALEEQDDDDGPPDCAVCMEPLVESAAVALRGCGHVFCQACIGKVAQVSAHCPFCRKTFVKDDMIAWSVASQAASKTEDTSDTTLMLSQQMDELGPSPKMLALLAALKELKPDEKAVVFSQFTKFLDEIEPFLKEHGFSFTRIDGKKSATQRLEALSSFDQKEGGPTIMLCSLHAAGTGINLTRANHAMMMDTWWNAAVEQQAMDRVHRIGQARPVRILRFITEGSVESRMLSLQEAKAAIGKGAFENLSPEEKRKARLGDVKKLLDLDD